MTSFSGCTLMVINFGAEDILQKMNDFVSVKQ